MLTPNKNISKRHTLYEAPKKQIEVWQLISESCFEIGCKLLKQKTYAFEVQLFLSGYNRTDKRDNLSIKPDNYIQYPSQIFRTISHDRRSYLLINRMLKDTRRINIHVVTKPLHFIPIFSIEQNQDDAETFQILKKIRDKIKDTACIGLGLEGIKSGRVKTYTPKRTDEIKRAISLLKKKPHLLELLKNGNYLTETP